MITRKCKHVISGAPYRDDDEAIEESQLDVGEDRVDDPTIDIGARTINNQLVTSQCAFGIEFN